MSGISTKLAKYQQRLQNKFKPLQSSTDGTKQNLQTFTIKYSLLAFLIFFSLSFSLRGNHQRNNIHNSSVAAVMFKPLPFMFNMPKRKRCGKNKSNYWPIRQQKPCRQRSLCRTGPRNKHRMARAACLKIRQRGTVAVISCVY